LKITKSQLNHIIKEELTKLLKENNNDIIFKPEKEERGPQHWGVYKWAQFRPGSAEALKKIGEAWQSEGGDGIYYAAFNANGERLGDAKTLEGLKKFYVPPEDSKERNTLELERHMRGMTNEEIRITIANTPLKDNSIVRKLGEGAFGTAFLLDNDHVLKIFKGGIEGVKRDINYYKKLQTSQTSGAGKSNEPAIYDYGQIENLPFYYAEMSKVIPLKDWFKMTEPPSGVKGYSRRDMAPAHYNSIKFKGELSKLAQGVWPDVAAMKASRWYKTLLKKYRGIFQNDGMTEKEVDGYLKSVEQLIDEEGVGKNKYYDVHFHNVGVMPRSDGSDEIIIFDF